MANVACGPQRQWRLVIRWAGVVPGRQSRAGERPPEHRPFKRACKGRTSVSVGTPGVQTGARGAESRAVGTPGVQAGRGRGGNMSVGTPGVQPGAWGAAWIPTAGDAVATGDGCHGDDRGRAAAPRSRRCRHRAQEVCPSQNSFGPPDRPPPSTPPSIGASHGRRWPSMQSDPPAIPPPEAALVSPGSPNCIRWHRIV